MQGVDLIIAIAVVAGLLMLIELLVPTGGVLAIIGAIGLIAAGVLAFGDDGEYADYAGGGLVAFGILSIVTFFVITPKVVRSQLDEPVRTGAEGLIGMKGEVREQLNPDGSVYVDGALWKARVSKGAAELDVGNSVEVQEVDGLTLVVGPAGE